MPDVGQDSVQCASELHGLGWRGLNGFGIDVVKAEVDDEAWTPVPLGHDAKWGQAQVWKTLHQTVGKDGPKAFVHEVGKLLPHESGVVRGRRVGAAIDAGLKARRGPRGSGELDRSPMSPETVEKRCRAMGQLPDGRGEVMVQTRRRDELVPSRRRGEAASGNGGQLTEAVV